MGGEEASNTVDIFLKKVMLIFFFKVYKTFILRENHIWCLSQNWDKTPIKLS